MATIGSQLRHTDGWLGSPPSANWEPETSSQNPFIRYRHLLWSHHRALAAGWSDAQFIETVLEIDEQLGFVVTPLTEQPALSEAVGTSLRVKDETGQVGGSHKARHLMGAALHLAVDEQHADGTPPMLAISSCGNAALGAATVASALGRPLDVFVPDWADKVVVDHIAGLGGNINVCERQPGQIGDPCMAAFLDAVGSGAVPFSVQGPLNPWIIDGGRTLGFELLEYMTTESWQPSDIYIQIGGGALASSAMQAFFEARGAGELADMPRFHAVQAEGCAPLARAAMAFRDAGENAMAQARKTPNPFMTAWEAEPTSLATGILDDITYDWLGVTAGVLDSNGSFPVAPEPLVAQAHRLAIEHTNISVTPTGSAGLAGLLHQPPVGSDALILFTGVQRS